MIENALVDFSQYKLRLVFAVTARGDSVACGDYFTALELGTALSARFGWNVEYRAADEDWYRLDGCDVVVAMTDQFRLSAVDRFRPNLIVVAWARNWFERWVLSDGRPAFDLILASSAFGARYLSDQTGQLAKVLRIGANPTRFDFGKRASLAELDYVFTGNYWGAPRDIVEALAQLPRNRRGAIYGKGWESIPKLMHLNHGFVPYAELASVYARATIVIDDANHVTKDWAAANSRVFDAIAAGCLVITNSQSVSDEVFGGELPVYRSPAHLAELVDTYVEREDARKDLQNKLRELVLREHCYRHRAFEFALHLSRVLPALCRQTPQLVQREPVESSEILPTKAKKLPRVSFVVPLFNHLDATQAMLSSLQASVPDDLDYEIVMCDDASSDGTGAWLRSLRDRRIQIVLNDRNCGFAANSNAGVRVARGDVLVLLNNDTEMDAGWLEPMLSILSDETLNVGIVGNVQLRFDDGRLDHCGVELNPFGQLEHLRTQQKTIGCTEVFAVTGACMAMRRKDFNAVGGFDEVYLNGSEDIDLCLKMHEVGKKVIVSYDSKIRHHVSLSRGPTSVQDERNSRTLFTRWRNVFKTRLALSWLHLLQSGDYLRLVDCLLEKAFIAAPVFASETIAESILLTQERRWRRLLDSDNLPIRLNLRSGSVSADEGHICLSNECVLEFDGIEGVRNFFVCGEISENSQEVDILIGIELNCNQSKEFTVQPGSRFNLGMRAPLVFAHGKNLIRISFLAEQGRGCPAPRISHFVIDDDLFPVSELFNCV